jgi:hypothetical protein
MWNQYPYILMFGEIKVQARWMAFSKSLIIDIGLKSQCTALHFSRMCFQHQLYVSVVFPANKLKKQTVCNDHLCDHVL